VANDAVHLCTVKRPVAKILYYLQIFITPLIAHRSSFITHRSLLIASLFFAHCSSLIAHCSSFIAHSGDWFSTALFSTKTESFELTHTCVVRIWTRRVVFIVTSMSLFMLNEGCSGSERRRIAPLTFEFASEPLRWWWWCFPVYLTKQSIIFAWYRLENAYMMSSWRPC